MKRLTLVAALLVALPLHAAGYHVVRRIPVGGSGYWDYPAIDGNLLFLAHGTVVDVVNLTSGKKVAEIDKLDGVHGIAFADELHRGYVTNGRAGTVTVFEISSLKKVAEWKATGENPDAVLYDRSSGHLFTFNGRGRNITVFDAKSGAVVATIPVGAKPEFGVSRGNGVVYVNLEDTNEIAEVDGKSARVLRRWPIAPCQSPTGLAIDTRSARLFSVCANGMMAVSDADKAKVVATVPIGAGPDGAAFDPQKQLAFSSNGRDGTLTVVEEVSPDQFRVVATVDTARSARTIILDTKSHHLYLPAAKVGEDRKVEPGSFEVIDVAP